MTSKELSDMCKQLLANETLTEDETSVVTYWVADKNIPEGERYVVATAWANGQVVKTQAEQRHEELLASLVDGDLIELDDGSEAYYCDKVGPFHRIYTINEGSQHYSTVRGDEIRCVLEKVRPGSVGTEPWKPWRRSLVADLIRATPKCNCGGKICGVPCRDYCWLESGVP